MKTTENEDQKPGLSRLALTMRETAEVLGVSYMTVHRLLKSGLLKSSFAVRHKLIPVSEIERFLKETLE
jgi:excisionase family DNA binding protein